MEDAHLQGLQDMLAAYMVPHTATPCLQYVLGLRRAPTNLQRRGRLLMVGFSQDDVVLEAPKGRDSQAEFPQDLFFVEDRIPQGVRDGIGTGYSRTQCTVTGGNPKKPAKQQFPLWA